MEYFYLAVFKGTYRHRIDPKGRLPVPAAFRRTLAGEGVSSLVVTLLDQCLAAYPPGEWARLEAQLRRSPPSAGRSRPSPACSSAAPRTAISTRRDASCCPCCCADAGLAQDVVVVGVLNRFEVWAPDAWEAFLRDSERLLDDVTLDVQWPLPPAVPSGGRKGPLPARSSTGETQPLVHFRLDTPFPAV